MRNGYFTGLFLPLALFSFFPALAWAAGGPDAKTDLGANAALKYWTAFAFLPPLDHNEEVLLKKCTTVRLDPAVLTLIERSRLSREYLHHAVKIPACEWSLEYGEGINLRLPHLEKARTLARLAVLHARNELEQGHWKEGAEDVTALLKMGRHLEMSPMFIPNLVGFAIESLAIETAAPYLPDLKQDLPEVGSEVLAAPPASPSLARMVLFEREISARWLIRELREVERRKPGSWRETWTEIFRTPEGGPTSDVVETPRTFEQAVKLLEDTLPFYDQMAKLTELPWKELDARLPVFLEKAKASNPPGGGLLPAPHKFVPSQRRVQTQKALLRAALAVLQGGPDQLKEFQDPYGDGPFEYRALDKGFELKSKLLLQDKPVTLRVGQRKRE